MSLDDFCRLSPDEFAAVCRAYAEAREAEARDGWERMRLLATITIQPHVKRKITARRLLPFPWDNRRPEREERPRETREQSLEKLAAVLEKLRKKK